MANHAFVIPRKLPPAEQIDQDVREIVQRQFPQLTVDFSPEEKSWLVSYNNDGHLALTFWIGKSYRAKKPNCIEFRHGHGYNCLWWIENQIREQLAEKYKARCYDDGIGWYEREYVHYPTYREYLLKTHMQHLSSHPSYDGLMKQHVKMMMDIDRETMPPELHHLLGDDIT